MFPMKEGRQFFSSINSYIRPTSAAPDQAVPGGKQGPKAEFARLDDVG